MSIPLLNFDGATQDKINQLQQQVAATRVATQAQLTATAQAAANRALIATVVLELANRLKYVLTLFWHFI